jgi:hypothetical protein
MTTKNLFIAFIAIVGGVVGTWIFNRYEHGRALHVQFKSPKETYSVKLDADDAPAPNPLNLFWPDDYRNRIVRATILTKDQPYLSDFVIYRGDAFDSSFKDRYPDHEWLSESVLLLGDGTEQDVPRQKDQIIISNQSDESLSHVFLNAGTNIFFVLDLPAGSTIEIPIYLDRLDRFMVFEGRFNGGKSTKLQEVAFASSEQQESPVHYCIKVENSSLLIQSPELDSRIVSHLGDITVPKGNCGL